mgnify:CR=1 FL=1
MEAALEHLLYSPRLAIYSRYIQSVLSDERERREKFYEEIKEDQKAEFINGEIIVHSPVKLEHTIAGKLLLFDKLKQNELDFAEVDGQIIGEICPQKVVLICV